MKDRKFWGLAGMCAGLLAIIFGIIVLVADCGNTVETTLFFGADFYTESYQATANAAMNLYALAKIAKLGLGFLLISLGLFDICLFGGKLTRSLHKEAPAAPADTGSLYAPAAAEQSAPASQNTPEENEVVS